MKDRLLGRDREREELDRLLSEAREGRSGVLVLRGEAGIGKSALLAYAAMRAEKTRVVRVAGVEAESGFAYSALQHVCAPLMSHLEVLPQVQQHALRVAFGLAVGDPPEQVLLGMAVLGLFSEAAVESPLVCLVDDAQWLDPTSQQILAFVGRRLHAESVALVFAERVTATDDECLAGLPALLVPGLSDADARTVLDRVLPEPVDDRIRDRIITETGGNPLALLELPRGLSSAELAFGFDGPGIQHAAPVANRVEDGFRRRVETLPAKTRTLLLTAAVEPAGDGPLLWRALKLLGIGPEAAALAEAAGLLRVGAPVRFRHPLVRSAVWRGADPVDLRVVHGALARAHDAVRDPDRRAWHQAHATVGPNEQVASMLERSADRALDRGGRAAAASFLERATALTPDRRDRARRALAAASAHLAAGAPDRVLDLLDAAELGSLDREQQARTACLRAMALYLTKPGRTAVQPLLAATAQLQDFDPTAARATCLSAVSAAMWTGRIDPEGVRQTVETARSLPPGDDVAGVFLRAFVTWSSDGPGAAAPLLRQVLNVHATDGDTGALWLALTSAVELGDLQACLDISERAATFARATGTVSLIPTALAYRMAGLVHAGRFAEAQGLLAEAAAAAEAMGLDAPTIARALLGAFGGQARTAVELIEALEREGKQRGMGRLLSVAGCARAVLHNGLGNYSLAFEAARSTLEHQDFAVHHWALTELVEAASRVGEQAAAVEARDQLSHWARTGTPWAQGAHALAEALAGTPGPGIRTGLTESRYREAIGHFERGGLGVLRVRSRLLFGEWLRRQNRRVQARVELRAAHEAAAAMGMEAFAERARRELLATGETVRKRTAGAPVLTHQETQIARLAAAEHSNAEIGAKLFLSPRTVEWHLRKIFTKLGVSSRRELDGALPGP